MALDGVGIWSSELRYHDDPAASSDAAAELEQLGYRALWFPGNQGGDVLDHAGRLLDATRDVPIATGILNLWAHEPAAVAARDAEFRRAHPGRFLLGVGVGHAKWVDETFAPGHWRRPLATTRAYIDALDAAAEPVPRGERALAALGPRMLELARDRTAGAHTYFVPVAHTRAARAALGPAALLAPMQAVVLETDPVRARAIARGFAARPLGLTNYTANLLRHGFGPRDLEAGGSDRLIDAVVAWGTADAIRAHVQAHLTAGADHVCLQVITDRAGELPRAQWRRLAASLVGLARG